MKNCEQIKDLLSLYLDNELHENERKQVVKHLEQCVECKKELEYLKDIVESLGELEEVELPEDYNVKLHEKLVQESKNIKPKGWAKHTKFIKWASTVAAGFLFFVIALNVNPFDKMLENSKFAYINDTHLQLSESMDGMTVADNERISNNKNLKMKSSDTAVYNDSATEQMKSNDLNSNGYVNEKSPEIYQTAKDIGHIPEPEEISENSITPGDTQIFENNIEKTQIPNDDFSGEIVESIPQNDMKRPDSIDENDSLKMALTSIESDMEVAMENELEMDLSSEQAEARVTTWVQDHSQVASKVMSMVQNLGGEIEEVALLTSLKDEYEPIERYFIIYMNSSDFDKVLNSIKYNGIITENTFENAYEGVDIKVKLKIVQKEFIKGR